MKWLRKKYTRKDIVKFLIFVILAIFLAYLHEKFGNLPIEWMWAVTALMLFGLLTYIYVKVGAIVLKSLFTFSAELSLIIFIAYTYCDTSLRTVKSDQALQSLVAFGLLFIGYSFVKNLTGALSEKYEKIKDEPWSREKVLFVLISVSFVVLFLWQIYLVMEPIILDLCVFKA